MSTAITVPIWKIADCGIEWISEPPSTAQDVVVVGAGISGLTTALCLLREGRQVLLIEREDIGAGETSRTTAHLASALDDRFFLLARHHGRAGAGIAAASHAAAIDWMESLAGASGECGFKRVPGYLFSHDGDLSQLEKEAEAAATAGLSVSYLRDGIPGMQGLGPALRFENQARVDIGPYIAALARAASDAGCRFLRAEATQVRGGDMPTVSLREEEDITARAVVVASNVPFHETGSTFHKQAPYRTFAVAGRIDKDAVPDALFWDDGDPYHYVRLHESAEGDTFLIVGGEDHKTGQDDDPKVYKRLQDWTRERFPGVTTFNWGWSGQVLEPVDGLGFIGADPANQNVYLITGDSGNGITHGTLGGLLIADLIAGRNNEWAKVYDPGRKPVASAGEWLRENSNVALQYTDWIRPSSVDDPHELARGTGAITRRGVHLVAVYRAGDGTLHAHNARCPHLGCVVRWSSEEKSWDCPCHGSRFDAATGAILNGPTSEPLEPFDLQEAAGPEP